MCFSPQRRAIFQHQHLQKCSRNAVFCTFSLPNVLFPTAACIFSTSARTKVVQTRHVLYILTSELLHSFRHQNFKKCPEDVSFLTFSLPNVLFATAACNFSAAALTKVLSECGVLYIFTSECAFRHSGMHFFNISTYKSGPNTSCFVHFDFRIAPQLSTSELQKVLPNVLFATAACNFSTSELTKVLSECGVLYIFTSECAFRHSGVQFFDIRTSKVLRGRQFFNIFTSECAFHHSGMQFFDIRTWKSSPRPSVFLHFHFQMCFSPQRRHQHVQKWSKHLMFCTFSLQNVLFATAACNFCVIRWPPDSAPAALTGLLFDWPDTRIIEKTQHFVTSLTFSADVSSFTWLWHYCIFCRLIWLLCCCALHLLFNSPYCRKFLFKLPSINKKWLIVIGSGNILPSAKDQNLCTLSAPVVSPFAEGLRCKDRAEKKEPQVMVGE